MTFSRNLFVVSVLFVISVLCYLLIPEPPLLQDLSTSQVVYSRDHQVLRLTLSDDDKYRLVLNRAQVSPDLVEALLLKEDRLFYYHAGVNPWSLVRAAIETYFLQGQRQGGSTITMQVARLKYGLKTRSVSGKIKQIIKAIELERHYSKDDILTAYLSLLPYGRNIEGVGAASLIYFRKDPSDLNLAEILTLSVIPQSPGQRDLNRESTQASLSMARNQLFDVWVREHPEDLNKKTILDLPIKALSIKDLPFLAPHFVNQVIQQDASSPILVTTLDLKLQRLLERHVTQFVEGHHDVGIENAAAILVNSNTMEVVAHVGSADFFNEKIQGQVDGTRARRSPGSALKPFIYALAMDQGIVHPQSLLKDTPSHFGGGYDPENFERDFLGPITAHDALIKSRNIPALALTAQVREPSVYEFFTSADIQQMREKDFYGLALSLGGVEITMEEMVKLYAMLGNGGRLQSLSLVVRRLSSVGARHAVPLLSPEASFLTLDILKDNPRPDSFSFRESSKRFPIAWKTGTSYSFRDAWSVGLFGPYVLCVWVGNFNGKGNPAFVGREAAAPLLFRIAEDLRIQKLWTFDFLTRANQLNVKKVKVCSVSGEIVNEDCPHVKEAWFIPGKSPIKTCSIHRSVPIDPSTGLRACSDSGSNVTHKVFEFWPTDLLALFKLAGLSRQVPPPYDAQCSLDVRSNQGLSPQIISPLGFVTYSLQASKMLTEKIAFKAAGDSDARELNWFVDEAFVGRVKSSETLFWPAQAGEFTVRVVDEHGRAGTQKMVVKMVQ